MVGGRRDAVDDNWGAVEASIRLHGSRVGRESVIGLDQFSHLVVVFQFHLVAEGDIVTGVRHPRGDTAWPAVGMFAQRARMRPNRIGVSTCALLGVDGLVLRVRGLDAVDATPVLDVKPFMREFEPPADEVRQPTWASELIRGYY